MSGDVVTSQTEALLAEFAQSGLRELHIRSREFEIYLSNDPSSSLVVARRNDAQLPTAIRTSPAIAQQSPVMAPVVAAKAADDTISPDATIVRAPNLGTFYGAPKPGAAAYVSVGSIVTEGEELCLIEVMKLFTTVRSQFSGRIEAVLATDGEMVEAGQPLFSILKI